MEHGKHKGKSMEGMKKKCYGEMCGENKSHKKMIDKEEED